MNLKEETLKVLGDNGYGPDDVLAMGCQGFRIPAERFWGIAGVTDYDPGFGSAEVAEDLVIWMRDGGAFIRHEYDGSEWWRFVPKAPDCERDDVFALAGRWKGRMGLAGINRIGEEAPDE